MTDSATTISGEQVQIGGDGAVLAHRDGHILTVTINRPEARNAVNMNVMIGIGEALEVAENDHDIWVVIITGAGDKSFCAGADLKAAARGELTPTDDRVKAWGFAGFVEHHVSKPVIAAVNGFALGGGTEILLQCDLAVSIDTASFGLPEVKRGIYAGAGGAFRLGRQIPRKIAMEAMLTGEPISAQRALEVGLVNRVVPADQLTDAARDLAERICANAPLAVQVTKRIAQGITDGHRDDEVADWERNAAEGEILLASDDTREGLAAFAEKRAPRWTGR
ncbi:crotonase/enoyl-CoA hydratase family protein [Microbacterium sp. No. 7]|uniref:crotonase/enoyl-CoA hydratase family protein n=1 Tax=Microbacterium sp. No. 7 TaxID=1714373 RepID=UPI0006D0E042|nr:crotonase/enoyl-CoA hydratase family protein [Microbacterium sp. No. 7]ALJ19945.1 enoyl-CoA hydratase [Microbacterium sp. No. 7]